MDLCRQVNDVDLIGTKISLAVSGNGDQHRIFPSSARH
jgi:hypothetical protein